MKLCAECSEKYWKALDAKMPPPPVTLVQIGRPRARDIESARQRRADDHYRVIREYQDWLKEYCEAHHDADRT